METTPFFFTEELYIFIKYVKTERAKLSPYPQPTSTVFQIYCFYFTIIIFIDSFSLYISFYFLLTFLIIYYFFLFYY